MDLLLVETINVSIDCVVIKYLISMKRKIYSIERQHKVLFDLFCLIIVSRESDYLCVYFSMKCLMSTLNFVLLPNCTGGLHGMGLNQCNNQQTFIHLKQPFFAEWN